MNLTARIAGIALLMMGAATIMPAPTSIPEIDPNMGLNAVAIIGGALLIMRSRKA